MFNTRSQSCCPIPFVVVLLLALFAPYKSLRAEEATLRGQLAIEMDTPQSADAPVIFSIRLTNISDEDLRDYFDENILFRTSLTGPDGRMRRVVVTNGSRIEGSFGPPDTLKPGQSVTTPLRLTNVEMAPSDFLPSEQVYLPPGAYHLKVEYHRLSSAVVEAIGERSFTVVNDADLAKRRQEYLRHPPKELDAFARHVQETTLTPEIRKAWYEQLKDSHPRTAAFKMYALSVIQDPPPDIAPAILEALRVHVTNPNIDDRDLEGLLNNAAYAVLNLRPPGAGDVLLLLATSRHDPNARTPAIEALQYYYEDAMTPQVVPLLTDQNRWVRLYAAWSLAWAGDERGADILIEAASQPDVDGRVFAAGALSYLPHHNTAAETLKTALASPDTKFVKELREYLAKLPLPRFGAGEGKVPATAVPGT